MVNFLIILYMQLRKGNFMILYMQLHMVNCLIILYAITLG